MKVTENIEVNKKDLDNERGVSKSASWLMDHPVKAGVICLASFFIARAVGVKKISKILVLTGLRKTATASAVAAYKNY